MKYDQNVVQEGLDFSRRGGSKMLQVNLTFKQFVSAAKSMPYTQRSCLVDELLHEETDDDFEKWLASLKKKRSIKDYSDQEIVDIIHKTRKKR